MQCAAHGQRWHVMHRRESSNGGGADAGSAGEDPEMRVQLGKTQRCGFSWGRPRDAGSAGVDPEMRVQLG